MKKTQHQKEDSGLPSRPMTCSADAPDRNAERITPEQRADAIIHVLYDDGIFPLKFELRDTIAAEIREAVELEREACANISDDIGNSKLYKYPDCRCEKISQAIRRR